MISLDSPVTAAPNQASSVVGSEVVILNLQSGAYFGLEEVGMRVWDLIHEGTTGRSILQVLLTEYEVEPAQCERDLTALLTELVEKGLITIADSESA